jgi:hypothetical protein
MSIVVLFSIALGIQKKLILVHLGNDPKNGPNALVMYWNRVGFSGTSTAKSMSVLASARKKCVSRSPSYGKLRRHISSPVPNRNLLTVDGPHRAQTCDSGAVPSLGLARALDRFRKHLVPSFQPTDGSRRQCRRNYIAPPAIHRRMRPNERTISIPTKR